MPLIKCYECGKEISSLAAVCPGCGAPPRLAATYKASEAPPLPPLQNTIPAKAGSPNKEYSVGYLYAAYWAFVTCCCATRAFVTWSLALNHPLPLDVTKRTEVITLLALWPVATLFFALVTFRLFTKKVSYPMILFLATIHALNVAFEGFIPYKILLWVIFSGAAILYFRKRELLGKRVVRALG